MTRSPQFDPTTIIQVLATTPGILIPLLAEFSPEELVRRPAEGRWSAHENACHLTSFDALFERRLDQMLAEDAPELETYTMDPRDQTGALLEKDLEAALERFSETRPKLVARLEGLSAGDWERAGKHPAFPTMNVFVLFRHLALHDMIHTYRIEECRLRKP